MSNNFFLAATASAILLTAPALAAVATTHAMQSATMANSKTGSTMAAPTKTASTKTASIKTMPSKVASAKIMSHRIATAKASHHHHAKMATNVSVQGDREARALNVLESAGYRQFTNLHANGTNFVATATRAGQPYDVTVTPQGRIEARKA